MMSVATAIRTTASLRQTAHLAAQTNMLAAGAFLLTVTLRLVGMRRSADVFVDEVIYQNLGTSAAGGGFPRTGDGLFFLHPPGFFYLQAAWIKAFGQAPDVVAGVYQIRVLNALLAGATAALLVLLLTRARSRLAGVTAAVLFALDPYCIRQNNRAMLETETMLWVLAGYLVLLPLTQRPLAKRAEGRAVCAGLLFGLALLTKDHAALITVLPLFLAVLLNWGPPRRLSLISMSVAMLSYGVYVLVVYAAGHIDAFWYAKTHGLSRLLGFVQETGFNAHGKPSLADRLVEEVSAYAPTYALLSLGPLALLLLLRRRDPLHRLFALLQLSAGFTLVYALTVGTLEEQALYLLIAPNLLALALAFPALRRGSGSRHRVAWRRSVRSAARWGAVVVLVVTVVASGVSYYGSRTRSDDGFAQLRDYMAAHVPVGTTIAVVDGAATSGVTEWTLKDRYHPSTWAGPHKPPTQARYLVVPWKVITDGYGKFTTAEVRSLTHRSQLLFAFHGRTYGVLALYKLPPPPATVPQAQGGAGHGR